MLCGSGNRSPPTILYLSRWQKRAITKNGHEYARSVWSEKKVSTTVQPGIESKHAPRAITLRIDWPKSISYPSISLFLRDNDPQVHSPIESRRAPGVANRVKTRPRSHHDIDWSKACTRLIAHFRRTMTHRYTCRRLIIYFDELRTYY